MKKPKLTDEVINHLANLVICYCPCALDGDRPLLRGLIFLVDDIVQEAVIRDRKDRVEASSN